MLRQSFSHILAKAASPLDPGDVYIVPELTTMQVGFMMDDVETPDIAGAMCPAIQVGTQDGGYMSWPRGHFFRDEMKKRTDGAPSAGGHMNLDNSPRYHTDVFAWHTDLGPQVRANAKTVDLDRGATMLCANKARLRRQKLWFETAYKTGVWWKDVAGVAANPVIGTSVLSWKDPLANPIKDIKQLKRLQQAKTGFKPNKLVLSGDVWDVVSEHPNVLSRVWNGQTPGGPAQIDVQRFAELCGLKEVLIAEQVEAQNEEGTATENDLAFIAGAGTALLGYVPQAAGIMIPASTYFFDWVADGLVGSMGNVVSRWYIQETKAVRYETEMGTGCKVIASDCSMFLSGLLT